MRNESVIGPIKLFVIIICLSVPATAADKVMSVHEARINCVEIRENLKVATAVYYAAKWKKSEAKNMVKYGDKRDRYRSLWKPIKSWCKEQGITLYN
jgi:hypothetical protein